MKRLIGLMLAVCTMVMAVPTVGLAAEMKDWKVTIPIGEKYVVSLTDKIELDTPAYLSKDGYTMLPVRAIAKALGIHSNWVIWEQDTKEVTILVGEEVITMKVGEKKVTVSGDEIPTSAVVEIVNNRAFLPMRDLANVIGVTEITWDATTKTAVLEGSWREPSGR